MKMFRKHARPALASATSASRTARTTSPHVGIILILSLLAAVAVAGLPGATEARKRVDLVPFTATSSSNTLVLGTLDGTVYGLDRSTGDVLWAMDSGKSLVTSSNAPIVPALDGSIFLSTPSGLRVHSASVKDIVAMSPVSFGDDVIFLGSKTTSLFVLDAQTGQVVTCYGERQGVDVETCEIPTVPVFVGRVDYTVRAIDKHSNRERWNVTLGEYTNANVNALDDESDEEELKGVVLAASLDGHVRLLRGDNGAAMWEQRLPSLVVHGHVAGAEGTNLRVLYSDQLLLHGEEVLIARGPQSLLALPPPSDNFVSSLNFPLIRSVVAPDDEKAERTAEETALWLIKARHSRHFSDVSECEGSPFYPDCLIGLHHAVDYQPRIGTHVAPTWPPRLPSPNESPTIAVTTARSPLLYIFLSAVGGATVTFILWRIFEFYKSRKPASMPSKRKAKRKRGNNAASAEKSGEKNDENHAPEAEEKQEDEILEKEKELEGALRMVGRLTIETDSVLGHGSRGTIVYRGTCDGRTVAIKRMLADYYGDAQSEMEVLVRADEHPNVLRYFAIERDQQFVYLALALCPQTLQQFVESESYASFDANMKKNLLLQLAEGIAHLHSLQIVHRDLKPANVLLDANMRVKLSDMGLAKLLGERSSFTAIAQGTLGWLAPELISAKVSDGPIRATKKVDVFAFGCIVHYVLTKLHPFGEPYEREVNCIKGKVKMVASALDSCAADLITLCIARNPDKRPESAEVPKHVYFWSDLKQLQFLRDASDKLEFEKPTHPLCVAFEQKNAEVIGSDDWTTFLHEQLLLDLHRYRKYDVSKLRDLLRVIRNKAHHYRDLPPELQAELGSLPEGYLKYFTSAFPALLPYTYHYMKDVGEGDPAFAEYF